MKLDKILEAAEKEGVPKSKIESYVNYCFKSSLKSRRPDTYEYMAHLFEGADIKFTAEEAREIVLSYLDGQYWTESDGNLFGLLHGLIPEEEVKGWYYEQWKETYNRNYPSYEKIQCIREITGVEVPFSQEEMSERFQWLIDNNDFSELVDFLEATLFKPSKEAVQNVYDLLVRGQSIKFNAPLIPRIEKITGVKPVFDNDVVQKGFIEILKDGSDDSYFAVSNLEQATGINPNYSKEAIDGVYQELFEKKHYKQMVDVKNITKMAPSLPQEQVNAAADACAEKGNVENLELICKQLSSNRVTLRLGKVQQGYRALAKYKNVDSMRELKFLTGVQMPEDVAKKILETEVESRIDSYEDSFMDTVCLIKHCGAKPDEGLVNKRLSILLEKDEWGQYSKLQKEAGTEPGENVYRAAVQAMKGDIEKNPNLLEGY